MSLGWITALNSISQDDEDWYSSSQNLSATEATIYAKHAQDSQNLVGVEIAAIALSFLAFIALVIVLQQYDGQLQQAWPYDHLTLNGLIALLSTVTRACLFVPVAASISQGKWIWFAPHGGKGKRLEDIDLIDSSSRGAWGSFKLLWRTRGRYLVSLGALLTIAALAFDTFSQQVLGVKFRDVGLSNPPVQLQVPRSEVYLADHMFGDLADLPMQSAIMTGLLDDSVPDLPVLCTTGHCAWPTIPILGVCGVCKDVTGTLSRRRNITTGLQAGDGSGNATRTEDISIWSLPSGTSISTNSTCFAGPGQNCTGTREQVSGELFVANATLPGLYQNFLNAADNLPDSASVNSTGFGTLFYDPWIARLEFLGAPWQGDSIPYTAWPAIDGSNIVATQCNIWSCVQALNVTVQAGRQTEMVTRASNQTNLWSQQDTCIAYNANTCNTYSLTDIPRDFNVAPGAVFTMNTNVASAIGNSLAAAINQTTGVWGFTSVDYPSDADIKWDSGFARAMWQGSTNYQAYIDKLTKGMTNAIRKTSPATEAHPNYAGKAYATQSFIHVRWAWIAYPTAMLLLGLFFFLASMWQSHHTNAMECYAWKDSALVLLTMSLDKKIMQKAKGGLARPGELAERIGKERVFLENDGRQLAMKMQE